MPLVAGLHWKSAPKDALQKKWEGKNIFVLFKIPSIITLFTFNVR